MSKFQFRRKHLIFVAIIVAVLGIWFWRRQANLPEYQEYTVETIDIRDTLELSGKVSAGKSAALRFGAGGYVTYVGAKEGDRVSKWQTLASIDTRQLQKVLDQKLNLYAIQRGTFEQTIDDNDNSVPDGDLARELDRLLAKNQYQLENTVLDVEYQDLTLKLARLSSPMDGILVIAPVTVPYVQVAATDLWIIVDPTTLEFLADLDETDLAKAEIGQKVIVTLDAYPDREFESTITSISYSPKETSIGTTYEVQITLPESELSTLRLGLNGAAAVVREEKLRVTALPSAALQSENGQLVVTVLENGKYENRQVETGIENDGMVEILKGLESGEHVYIKK